jgi:thioredoxin-related protein
MHRRKFLAIALAAMCSPLLPGYRQGAEAAAASLRLVMFESGGCPSCHQFRSEMKDRYESSALGARMPLEIHDYSVARRLFRLKYAITATPTFVVMRDGQELERFVGFLGAQSFTRTVSRLGAKYAAG